MNLFVDPQIWINSLALIALVLIAGGFGVHVPKGYVCAVMGFSVLVETLNLVAAARRKRLVVSRQTVGAHDAKHP